MVVSEEVGPGLVVSEEVGPGLVVSKEVGPGMVRFDPRGLVSEEYGTRAGGVRSLVCDLRRDGPADRRRALVRPIEIDELGLGEGALAKRGVRRGDAP
jgi:hypothetical protein